MLTAMVPELDGVDPDDAFSSVPYVKGSSLLQLLEQKLGGPGKCILVKYQTLIRQLKFEDFIKFAAVFGIRLFFVKILILFEKA